jgi:acyl dehydratase
MRSELRAIARTLSHESMARFLGGSNIHSNDEAAWRAGLKDGAIAQGGQLVAYLNEMAADAFGLGFFSDGSMSVAFRKAVRPGDTVTTRGVLARVEGDRAHYDVWLENQNGERVVTGALTTSTG